jgi:hypothetical protein
MRKATALGRRLLMSRSVGLTPSLFLAATLVGCGEPAPSADELALYLPDKGSLASKCFVLNDASGSVPDTESLTVEKALRRLKAHVKNGKLYDRSDKPIFFHSPYSGGAPPGEQMQEEMRKELDDLCKRGTVISIPDPDAHLRP